MSCYQVNIDNHFGDDVCVAAVATVKGDKLCCLDFLLAFIQFETLCYGEFLYVCVAMV